MFESNKKNLDNSFYEGEDKYYNLLLRIKKLENRFRDLSTYEKLPSDIWSKSSGDITATGDTLKMNRGSNEKMEWILKNDDQEWRIINNGDPYQQFFVRDHTGTSYPFGIEPGCSTNLLWLDSDDRVGILDNSPANEIDVAGDVRADSFIEYSKIFEGDALKQLEKIKSKQGTKDKYAPGWGDVDHTTLPDMVKVDILENRYFDKKTNKEMPKNFNIWDAEKPDNYEKRTYIKSCRDLGANVQFLQRAIVQLLDRVKTLEGQL